MWERLNTPLPQNPDWNDALVARARAVILTNYNHVCIISWSLGNEAGMGPAMYAMEKEVREIETKYNPFPRPIHYESRDYGKDKVPFFDFISNMYAPIDEMV